jgi:hypothetical protein
MRYDHAFLKCFVMMFLVLGMLASLVDIVKADDVQDYSRKFDEQHSGYATPQQQLRRGQIYNQYNVWELEERLQKLENKRFADQLRLNSKLRDLEDNQF